MMGASGETFKLSEAPALNRFAVAHSGALPHLLEASLQLCVFFFISDIFTAIIITPLKQPHLVMSLAPNVVGDPALLSHFVKASLA